MAADSALKYRPDIDGLRAVAVLLVVFNHYRLRCTGGYVGVDVFFIISGYLIGASVIAEVSAGKFTFANFYERRVRRIFPALLVMLALTTAMASWVLTPADLIAYGRSLVAAVLSFSNMLFWSEAGYFDSASEAKPLLHTWSLAVEEQFYVFFPVFVVALIAWSRTKLKPLMWCVLAISLVFACAYTRSNPTAAFFFAPLRAWELLAGVLLSQYALDVMKSRPVREIASAAGVLMILVPGFVYTSATPFPGLATILPCLGSVLLIGAGKQGRSLAGSVLSWKPVTFIGLISYSLYLWHWPLLVFQNMGVLLPSLDPHSRSTRLLLMMIAIVVATLSWRFIETPFRKGALRPARLPLFVGSGAVTAALVLAGVGIISAKGFPSRASGTPAQVASYQKVTSYMSLGTSLTAWRRGTCFLEPKDSFSNYKPDQCLQPATDRNNYLLVGDSLAAQLYPGMQAAFPDSNVMQATMALCTPFTDLSVLEATYVKNCSSIAALQQSYLASHQGTVVLLAGDWKEKELDRLGAGIAQIKATGNEAVVFGPPLAFDMSLPQLLGTEMRLKKHGKDVESALTNHFVYDEKLDHHMQDLARDKWKVKYLSYFSLLCEEPKMVVAGEQWRTKSGCPVFADADVPLLFDEHHLTVEGAMLVGRLVGSHSGLPR